MSTMTPEESEQIAAAGSVFFQNMSGMILRNGLLGVYMLVFIITMHIILQKENTGQAHKALITVLLAGFVMVVLDTCAYIASDLFLVKFGLVESLPGGLITQEMAANLKNSLTYTLQNWSENFLYLIADTAIAWRACVLLAENRLIQWMLLIILLADIGVNIADCVVDTKAVINSNFNGLTLDWLITLCSLAVNVVATLLIAHRAWKHHQSTGAILHHKKTQVEAILALMVESGVIFGVVQTSCVIFGALKIHAAKFSPVDNANAFLQGLTIYSAVLNPVALVIMIQTGSTYEQSFHLEDVSSGN
ncbi:hypothetical protein BT96DRAFT_971630 [Gymnopus androsaceus JB14]|uniref:G-protein coupled receptors family 1 profile domain-containing protein n=1 Tax=Gymnopus androsaceus JB14 TaxID=1447944 RepID=A0A6A4IA29_9AGAR|nr:hypothetical protein BT96DRAFT_971630 [Gymnopus androsaceus JB14]